MPDTFEINAGELRYRVQIQANTPTKNNLGQNEPSWNTIACRWANIEPASGTFFTTTEQIRNKTTHKVTLRYFAGLTPRNRLIYNGRTFNVLQVLNEGEFNVRHTVLAEEVI